MKSMTKRTGAILAAAAVATAFTAAGTALIFRNGSTAVAVETENVGLSYYYGKLGNDETAKNFYGAFNALSDGGVLKTGKIEYNLIQNSVVTANDVAAYVNSGNTRIPKAYGAGRDAFIMDNPDLFYVDLFSTSINAGTIGNEYVAYLDSSAVDTLYVGGLTDSADKVAAAVRDYEDALAEITQGAKSAGEGAVEQIKYVNEYICSHVEYSYGTELSGNRYIDTPAADYVHTSYGALVLGKAVCEGYAKGFKAVMDRLGIPCVCVQGYGTNSDGVTEAHMWNTVLVDGKWYNVDVTWNDPVGGTAQNNERWLLLGSKNFDYSHERDGVISSSGYELDYPAVNPYDYGADGDDNGMDIDGSYETGGEYGDVLVYTVSYDGKGGEKLHEEGKYLAYRYGDLNNGEIEWGDWFSAVEGNEVAPAWFFEDTRSTLRVYPGTQYVQVALINRAPDESNGAFYPNEDRFGENAGKPLNYAYNADKLTAEDFIAKPSAPYENEGHGTYVPSPWGNVNPANTGTLPVNATYDIRITYTESLEKIDPAADVEMTYTVSRGDEEAHKSAVLTDFNWDGDKVITFKFTPSKMYINNLADYYFVPTNLYGTDSKKIPDAVTYCFKGKSVVCSKVFNDGRLYMNVFGEANLLDTSDLSITDFKDEDGNYYAASQRSQLMLVVNRPDEARESELKDVLLDETPIQENEIVTSATYEIDLQICGVVRQVPNGSYMQVAFGFPEGYSPSDAGTTFKIYHYKHDDAGNITGVEEIPVIITQYGLIAQVKSFSPFTIVQVKNTSAAVADGGKTIYASALGNGSVKSAEDSAICVVKDGSITYTIAADAGFKVSFVRLNGKAVDSSRYTDGTLTLTAAELENDNMLEVGFMTAEAAESYSAKGVELAVIPAEPDCVDPVDPDHGINGADDNVGTPGDKPNEDEGKKSGCGSAVEGAFGAVIALGALSVMLAVTAVLRKRNEFINL